MISYKKDSKNWIYTYLDIEKDRIYFMINYLDYNKFI